MMEIRATGIRPSVRAVALACVVASSGCATVSTIQRADEHTVKVFSGTRQDLRAIGGETAENARYRSPPPPYPLLDLPFSFALDVLMLPLTLPAAVSFTYTR